MLNLPHFRIDYHDFLRGSNSYVNYPDGGFLSTSYGINIFNTPGLLTTTPHKSETVHSSLGSSEPIIAWGLGPSSSGLGGELVALGVTGSSDGVFYNVNSSSGNITANGSADTTQAYNGNGFVDAIQYQGSWYFTSRVNVIKCSIDLNTKDLTFWTTTKSKSSLQQYSPHPMVVYNDILWIADQNYLHSLDGSTASTQVFDLPSGWVITAMCIYNNLIYMAAEPYWNASGFYHGQAKIFTWNGYSDSWLDEYDVDTRVNCLYVFDGTLFAFTQYYLGYFDGVRVKYLRPVLNQIFKSQVTQVDNSMFYVDGINMIRYGSPVPGTRKVFVNYIPATASQGYSAIIAHYLKQMIIVEKGNSNGLPYLVSDINAAGGSSESYLQDYNARFFSRPVRVRSVVVETESGLASGQSVDVNYFDHTGASKDAAFFGYSSNEFGTGALQGKNIWRFDVEDGIVTRTIRPSVTVAKDTKLRYVDFYYEQSEDDLNN